MNFASCRASFDTKTKLLTLHGVSMAKINDNWSQCYIGRI